MMFCHNVAEDGEASFVVLDPYEVLAHLLLTGLVFIIHVCYWEKICGIMVLLDLTTNIPHKDGEFLINPLQRVIRHVVDELVDCIQYRIISLMIEIVGIMKACFFKEVLMSEDMLTMLFIFCARVCRV